MKPTVSLIKCDSYNQPEVDKAIHEALQLLGGIAQFVKPGQKVLIKPNVLLSSSPETAVTTHPAVVSAVVREVIKAGGIALVGDSPGNAHSNVLQTMEKTGLKKAAEEAGGKIIYFQQEGIANIDNPSGNPKMKILQIAKIATEADCIINVAKLKTHTLTLFTGAIKNMFGVVPGFHKTLFHARAPRPEDFAELIVDVFSVVRPTLNIMDGIIGMEGPGPNNGYPRKLGAILASTDAVAMDALSSYLIGHDPFDIDITVSAYKRNLGEINLKNIEVLGAKANDLRQANWKHAPNLKSLTRWVPGFIYPLITPLLSQLMIFPYIDQKKCTKCLVCVNSCPVKTIIHDKKNKKVEIELKDCISCFCCHELCEYKAIELKRSWLARLTRIA